MKERYYSLDVFRGATVALMILVNNPGSWSYIYPPFDHSKWNGCTPTDLVFPFFLFAVGNAMAFVIPRFEHKPSSVFLKKVIKRSLLIFFIGLFLNWSPFFMWQNDSLVFKPWEWMGTDGNLHGIRILGVLQRIAIAYFLASLIVYYFKSKSVYLISVLILLAYWWITYSFGTAPDPYSLEGYFGIAVDKALLGEAHMYHGEGVAFDPEGFSSSFTPVVQVIIGYFAGHYIITKGKSYEMISNLFVVSGLLLFAGYAWDMSFPINKKIWTSSYVLYTSGLAIFTLAILIYAVEFKNLRGGWSRFFDVFGKNPLFIFVLSGFLPRVLGLIRIPSIKADGTSGFITPFGWFYEHVCKNIGDDLRMGSLLYSFCMIAFYWLIVYVLDRKKIYIKV